MVRNKVGVGKPDRVLSPINGLDIHISNRKRQAQHVIALQPDQRIKLARNLSFNTVAPFTKTVPEIYERKCEVSASRALNAKVGIAPGSCIEAANVIYANEADRTIHDERFAMIKRIASWIKNL